MTPQSTERSGDIPGRKWYVVAALVFIAGMALFAVFLSARLAKLGDDFVRVTVPGQAELPLEPGAYTIFHEQGSTTDGTDGRVIAGGNISGLRISVQKSAGGEAKIGSFFISNAKSFLTSAKQLMRRIRDKVPYSQGDKMMLGSGGGWMVEGSPQRLMRDYNQLVESYNRGGRV